MSDPLLRLIVGILVVGLSAALLVWHRRAWRRQVAQFGNDESRSVSQESRQTGSASALDPSSHPSRTTRKMDGNGHASRAGQSDPKMDAESESQQFTTSSPYSLDAKVVLRHFRIQMLQRSITSAAIGLIGVLMIVSRFVDNPTVLAFGLFFTVVLVLAIFTSAMIDGVRTQLFFRKNDLGYREAKRELLKEYARLKQLQQQPSPERPDTPDR